jgi:hypothetical protein
VGVPAKTSKTAGCYSCTGRFGFGCGREDESKVGHQYSPHKKPILFLTKAYIILTVEN